MRLYPYCVCDPLGREAIEGARGVDDAALRVFECGGLVAVVSELGDEAPTVTPENARAHNRVNARVLARTTPLPFRFGSLVAEARLAEFLKTNEVALREALARVRGCVEMSVKIMWNAPGKPVAAESEDATPPITYSRPRGHLTGTDFLLAKRREILGAEADKKSAEAVAALLAESVANVARESRVAVLPSPALVVRAAHLVERARLGEYRARLRALEAERAGNLNFLTSGAWPPYSFSDLRAI